MTLNILPNLRSKLEKVRLVVFDVDGTLTDGSLYYGANGEVLKRFFVKDGFGIVLLQRVGVGVAFLTAESSPAVIARAKKLEVQHVILGARDKRRELEALADQQQIPLEAVAYMGDDLTDYEALCAAGVAVCPADAIYPIRQIADYVTQLPAGRGAVREFCDILLAAQRKSPYADRIARQ